MFVSILCVIGSFVIVWPLMLSTSSFGGHVHNLLRAYMYMYINTCTCTNMVCVYVCVRLRQSDSSRPCSLTTFLPLSFTCVSIHSDHSSVAPDSLLPECLAFWHWYCFYIVNVHVRTTMYMSLFCWWLCCWKLQLRIDYSLLVHSSRLIRAGPAGWVSP